MAPDVHHGDGIPMQGARSCCDRRPVHDEMAGGMIFGRMKNERGAETRADRHHPRTADPDAPNVRRL